MRSITISKFTESIRPANMRTVHHVRYCEERPYLRAGYSVSAVQCVETTHIDPFNTAASGSGMDAPEHLPVGSIKAFFDGDDLSGWHCIGFCQRTVERTK